MNKKIALILLLCAATQAALGIAPTGDPRVRYVDYDANQVTAVRVQRGTATRIVLAPNEKILENGAASGFDADCSSPDAEWCIRADSGTNVILVKPKDGATHNNLELRTDQRDYSLYFDVLPDASRRSLAAAPLVSAGDWPVYRIVFRYAPSIRNAQSKTDTPPAPSVRELLGDARPVPRNWRYSMQVMDGAGDFMPEIVFDDGRFTYFRFPANRELPTIFYISSAGEEGRVNFHIDDHAPDIVVVERMAPRFVLRLGRTAIGIWNDAFDVDGLAPRDGTAVDGVSRVLR